MDDKITLKHFKQTLIEFVRDNKVDENDNLFPTFAKINAIVDEKIENLKNKK